MAETMSDVERVLWRIAELGARCSQHEAAGGRGPLWAELEETIAGLETELEGARQALEGAPARVRSLEGRLKVAQQQRDQERARVKECFADAEAARRERDRERQKARKAMAATVAAKNAAAEAIAAANRAKATAAESVARATAAEAAADQALAARDEALAARDEALAARDETEAALDDAVARGDRALAAREEAIRARDDAARALEVARTHIAELQGELEVARTRREETVDTLAARAEGAVVVLPGVKGPDASVGPVTPASRVSWQPTWSEWANPETDDDDDVTVSVSAADDVTDADAHDIRLDDSDGEEQTGVRRYLNVAATIAQLLPDDLTPLLMPGATVVRREGRLCATVAVPIHHRLAAPGSDGEQAERFAGAGFRVEWAAGAPLGV